MIDIFPDEEQFRPNPGGQEGFMDDFTHRYCAFCGGWDAGKTWAGTRKCISLHTFNAFTEEGAPTYVASLIVAPSYQLAMTVNIPKFQEALNEANIGFRFMADPKVFAFNLTDFGTKERPSMIYVRSADAASAIAGFEVGNVYGDEVARWPYTPLDPLSDAWLQADGRLRGEASRIKQFNMTYTPEGDNTRVFVDFELRPKRDHKLYRAHTRENIHGGIEFAAILEQQLSPELAQQYLGGHALSTSTGSVYSSYIENNQFDQDLKLNHQLPLQLAIDFNIDPGMHGIIGQYDSVKSVASAHYELHAARMDVNRLVTDLKEKIKYIEVIEKYKIRSPIEVYGDATGRNEWAATGESAWDVLCNALEAANIPFTLRVPSSNPPVSERVAAVNSAMMTATGQVRYVAHTRCILLRNDWELLRWRNGEIDKRDRKISHPSDADGYRIWYLMPIRKPEPQRSQNQVAFVRRR